MTKQELIANTASAANCTPAEAERIIDGMFTVIIEALRTQDRVELRPDFGSFVARRKGSAASLQRDPLVGEGTMQRVVSFKATPSFKRTLRVSGAIVSRERNHNESSANSPRKK